MKVEVECKVKVVGASIEEVLARVTEKLMVLKLTEDERERYAKEYRHWDEENEGDVDWSPVYLVKRSEGGEVISEIELRIKNV